MNTYTATLSDGTVATTRSESAFTHAVEVGLLAGAHRRDYTAALASARAIVSDASTGYLAEVPGAEERLDRAVGYQTRMEKNLAATEGHADDEVFAYQALCWATSAEEAEQQIKNTRVNRRYWKSIQVVPVA